jgi:hypothetical protein
MCTRNSVQEPSTLLLRTLVYKHKARVLRSRASRWRNCDPKGRFVLRRSVPLRDNPAVQMYPHIYALLKGLFRHNPWRLMPLSIYEGGLICDEGCFGGATYVPAYWHSSMISAAKDCFTAHFVSEEVPPLVRIFRRYGRQKSSIPSPDPVAPEPCLYPTGTRSLLMSAVDVGI